MISLVRIHVYHCASCILNIIVIPLSDEFVLTSRTVQVGEVQQLVCESQFGAKSHLEGDSEISVPTMAIDVAGITQTTKTNLTTKTDSSPYILRGVRQY